MAKKRNGLVELPALAAQTDGTLDQAGPDSAAAIGATEPVPGQEAPPAVLTHEVDPHPTPLPRRWWHVRLKHSPEAYVEAEDAGEAFARYKQHMHILGTSHTPQVSEVGIDETLPPGVVVIPAST